MSSSEEAMVELTSLPAFDLDFGFDDLDDPREVTVYPPDAVDVATTWISMDARHAVSLEDVA